MQLSRSVVGAFLLTLSVVILAGCQGGSVENAPGKDANVKKEYTKEDALKIKPKRGGSDESGN